MTERNDERLYEAVGIAEGFIEAKNDTECIAAWQYLIDTGMAWNLQGWFGREANRLIEDGHCKLAGSSPEEISE